LKCLGADESITAVADIYDWPVYIDKAGLNESLVSMLLPDLASNSAADGSLWLPTLSQAKDDARVRWMLDHVDSVGEPLIPATAIVNGLLNKAGSGKRLVDIVFSAPVRLGQFIRIDILGDHIVVQDNARSTVYAFSTIEESPGTEVPGFAKSLIAMARGGPPQSRSVDQLYKTMAANGFSYGRSFRLVKSFWSNKDIVLGVVAGNRKGTKYLDGIYNQSACILDACTHLATEWTEKYHPGKAAFPVHIGRVGVSNTPGDIYETVCAIIPGCGSSISTDDWLVLMRVSPLAPLEFVNEISVDMFAVSRTEMVCFERLCLQIVDHNSEEEEELVVLEKFDSTDEWSMVPASRRQGVSGSTNNLERLDQSRGYEIQVTGPMETSIRPLVTDSACEPDMIEIETKYWGLSFLDVLVAKGVMPSSMFGGEYSGVVTAVGEDVTEKFHIGDRVVAVHNGGGIKSRLVVPASNVSKFDSLQYTLEEAAGLPVSFCTALFAVQRGRVESGDTVLVHNITGGLGMAVVQVIEKLFQMLVSSFCMDHTKEPKIQRPSFRRFLISVRIVLLLIPFFILIYLNYVL
jgi:hypothetical protein